MRTMSAGGSTTAALLLAGVVMLPTGLTAQESPDSTRTFLVQIGAGSTLTGHLAMMTGFNYYTGNVRLGTRFAATVKDDEELMDLGVVVGLVSQSATAQASIGLAYISKTLTSECGFFVGPCSTRKTVGLALGADVFITRVISVGLMANVNTIHSYAAAVAFLSLGKPLARRAPKD